MATHQLAWATGILLVSTIVVPSGVSIGQTPRGFFTDVQRVEGLESNVRDQSSWVSADGLTVYFSSDRSNPGGPYPNSMDIWMSSRESPDRPFAEPVKVEAPISHDGTADCCMYLSDDQLTMFLSTRWPGTGSRDSDIWVTTRPDLTARWSPLENFSEINTSDAAEWGPSFTADGLTVVFTSQRDGGEDLFQATRAAATESFGEATSLSINTRMSDKNPSLSSDGLTLFFDSTRVGTTGPGFGPGDLWFTTRPSLADEFDEPQNLNVLGDGTQRNLLNTSSTEDVLPFVSPDWPAAGSKLYWTRLFNGTDWDLYEATWVPVPEPSALTLCALGAAATILAALRRRHEGNHAK